MKIVKANTVILSRLDETARKGIYQQIELVGRTCYKSKNKKVEEIEKQIEDLKALPETPVFNTQIQELEMQLEKAKKESAKLFVRGLIEHGHEAMIEHASLSVRFTVDRGVSHEIVRHRLFSFAQESTRYNNYSKDKYGKEITVIEPCWFNEIGEAMKEEIRSKPARDIRLAHGFSLREIQYGSWYSAMKAAEIAYFTMLTAGASAQEARAVLPNSLKTEIVVTGNMRNWRHFFRLRAACETGMPHPQMLEVAVPLLMKMYLLFPELFEDIYQKVPKEVLEKYYGNPYCASEEAD
jgi:thymidylate synthase (FAD)